MNVYRNALFCWFRVDVRVIFYTRAGREMCLQSEQFNNSDIPKCTQIFSKKNHAHYPHDDGLVTVILFERLNRYSI